MKNALTTSTPPSKMPDAVAGEMPVEKLLDHGQQAKKIIIIIIEITEALYLIQTTEVRLQKTYKITKERASANCNDGPNSPFSAWNIFVVSQKEEKCQISENNIIKTLFKYN